MGYSYITIIHIICGKVYKQYTLLYIIMLLDKLDSTTRTDSTLRPPRHMWDIAFVDSGMAYNSMLNIMCYHYNRWKDINTTEGVLKSKQCTAVLNTLTDLLTPRYNAGINTVYGKLPIPESYNKANIGRVIGGDGYFTKLTTHNTGIDFIWFDDFKNEFLFWGRYKRNVAKAIDLIHWRVVKYEYFTPTNKIVKAENGDNAGTNISENTNTIDPVWSASDKSDIPEEVQDPEPLKLNEEPILDEVSSMVGKDGVINENDTNLIGGILTKIIELIGGGDTTTFS